MTGTPVAVGLISLMGLARGSVSEDIAVLASPLANAQAVKTDPAVAGRIWVANKDSDSLTMFQLEPSTTGGAPRVVSAEEKRDSHSEHYMPQPTDIAFEPSGDFFASCHDDFNTYGNTRQGDGFMGPSLWKSNSFAQVNQGGRKWYADPRTRKTYYGSHVDMSHDSPFCTGLTYAGPSQTTAGFANPGYGQHVFYAVDYNPLRKGQGNVVRYDFGRDHGEGNNDHSDAALQRLQVTLTQQPDVPNHLAFVPLQTTTAAVFPPATPPLTRPRFAAPDAGVLLVSHAAKDEVLVIDLFSSKRDTDLRANEQVFAYAHHAVDYSPLLQGVSAAAALEVDSGYLSRLPLCAIAKEQRAVQAQGGVGATAALLWVGSYDTGRLTLARLTLTRGGDGSSKTSAAASILGTFETGLTSLSSLALVPSDPFSLYLTTATAPRPVLPGRFGEAASARNSMLAFLGEAAQMAAPSLFECEAEPAAASKNKKKKKKNKNKKAGKKKQKKKQRKKKIAP